jgi:hypothetical protein
MSVLRLQGRAAVALAVLTLAGSGALAATPAAATEARTAMTLPVPLTPEPDNSAAEAPAPETSSPEGSAPQGSAPEGSLARPKGKVISRLPLSIRERPRTTSGYLGAIQPGTVIYLSCKVVGQNVDGNDLWYLLGGGRPGYVAARYVKNLSPVPYCPR